MYRSFISKLLIAVLLAAVIPWLPAGPAAHAEPADGFEIWVDNANSYNTDGSTFIKSAGNWSANTTSVNAVYGTVFSSNDPAVSGTWIPNIPVAGDYEIYISWVAATNRSTAVQVEVQYDGGVDTSVTVDQTKNGSAANSPVWNRIGLYKLSAGTGNYVRLGGVDGGKYLVCDAVRFVYIPPGTTLPDPHPATVLDDASPHFSVEGNWISQTATEGVYGEQYTRTADGAGHAGSMAKWSIPSDLRAGYYDVHMMWKDGPDRADAAPLEIKFDLGLDTAKTVNQQTYGGQWNYIGTYPLSPDYGQYIAVAGSDNGVTVADAVKLVFREATPEAIPVQVPAAVDMPLQAGEEAVLDNHVAGVFKTTGAWTTATADAGYEGKDYRLAVNADSGTTATWTTPAILTRGKYEVYMKWPSGPDRVDAAPVYIRSSDRLDEFFGGKSFYQTDLSGKVNQREHGGEWNKLGTYTFYEGKTYTIKLVGGDQGVLAADAVKLKLVQPENVPVKTAPEHTGQPSRVEIIRDGEGNFGLLRDGQPYEINGICSTEGMEIAVSYGANAVRTYGTTHSDTETWDILDRAYENNVGVMLGFWLAQQNAGIDYSNPAYKAIIANQLENFRKTVLKYKDHPAVIMWAIGNEADKGNGDIFYHINEAAKIAHELDPNHPTVNVLAGSSPSKIVNIRTKAPEIDIIGINSYRAVGNIYNNVTNPELGGWTGPYMVTEYGPDQMMEVMKVNNIAPIEDPSDTIATLYKDRYMAEIAGRQDRVVGSFVFKFAEAMGSTGTVTWYNLLLDNMKTPILDEMMKVWTGEYPANRAPRVYGLTVNGIALNRDVASEAVFAPGQRVEATAVAGDYEQDGLAYGWELRYEMGTDTSKPPQEIPEFIYELNPQDPGGIFMYAPTLPGNYRLYVKVYDGHNNIGTANFPFQVQ